MSESKGTDAGIGVLFVLLFAAWLIFAWLQPVNRVYTTLSTEYAAAIPLVQHIVGILPAPPSYESSDSGGGPLGALGSGSIGVQQHVTILETLVEVRWLDGAGIFLAGLPLLVTTWLLGKAHRCARMRRGIAPSPTLQWIGWVIAIAGLAVVPAALAPFIWAPVLSFGWMGIAGCAVSAGGTYLIGHESRSG